jgi:hypothetical protein
MPMTSPSRSARAPPELPGEMAASVWIRSVRAEVAAGSPPVNSAAYAADYSRRHGGLEARWAPDRDRELTDYEVLVLVELRGGKVVAVYPDHGHLGARIPPHDLGWLRRAVGEGHVQLGRALDDVVVGYDVAVIAVDHAAPDPLLALGAERRILRDVHVYLHHAWPDLRGHLRHRLVRRRPLRGGLGKAGLPDPALL